MTHVARTMSIAALMLCAGSATAADRYWIAPILGTWDNPANWSLTDGGPPSGGLPQTGDNVNFTNRSTIIFTGPGPGAPAFGDVFIHGSGTGTTGFFHSAGLLDTFELRVGAGSARNEYTMSGGSLDAFFLRVGTNGGEGLFTMQDGASALVTRADIGGSLGTGTLEIEGGVFTAEQMYVSTLLGTFPALEGIGSVEITGGLLECTDFLSLGRAEGATLDHTGGELRIQNNFDIGQDENPSVSTHSGAAILNVPGTVRVGSNDGGYGVLRQFDATADIGTLIVGSGAGTVGRLEVGDIAGLAGTCDVGDVIIGQGGDARADVCSGLLTADTVTVGESVAGGSPSQSIDLRGGTITTECLRVGGAPGHTAIVRLNGGTLNAVRLDLGIADEAEGQFFANTGTLNADEIIVGNEGDAYFETDAADIDTQTLRIGGSPDHAAFLAMSGGTLHADLIEVRDAGSNGSITEQFFLREGLLVSQEMRIGPGAYARLGFGFSFDARIGDVINDGDVRFSGTSSILSGPVVFGNVRLLGRFENNGTLRFSPFTDNEDAFAMNLVNNGEIEVFIDDAAVVGGSIINGPAGRIAVSRNFVSDTGLLKAKSTAGITNNGTLELENALVSTPNGSTTNNGTITGFGEFDGSLVNNGQILPDPDDIEQPLVIDGGFESGPASSVRFVITPAGHNAVVVTSGDADLDGTVNLAFAQGVPLPPRGTEYELIRCDAGSVTGTFASEAILGFPCEIIYEPGRVLARALRCNAADFVAPFGVLDLADINTFTAAFMSNNPLADINGDTFLDLADINAFVAAFTGGCP